MANSKKAFKPTTVNNNDNPVVAWINLMLDGFRVAAVCVREEASEYEDDEYHGELKELALAEDTDTLNKLFGQFDVEVYIPTEKAEPKGGVRKGLAARTVRKPRAAKKTA